MILADLLDLINKDKREKLRIKTAKKFAIGIGVVAAGGVATGILLAPKSGKETRENFKKKAVSAAETIKDTVQKKAEMVKTSATHAEKEISKLIKNLNDKSEEVKKELINK